MIKDVFVILSIISELIYDKNKYNLLLHLTQPQPQPQLLIYYSTLNKVLYIPIFFKIDSISWIKEYFEFNIMKLNDKY